jgi:O-antigen/teichoic acid export membrane protein
MLEKILFFIKQSIVYSLGGLTLSLVGIFMVPLYTRVFTPDDYGVIYLIQITITFLTVLLMLGLDNANARYYMDSKDERDRNITASTTLFFVLTVVLACCLIFIGFSKEISQLIFKTGIYNKYLIIAAAAVPFGLCTTLCINLLRFNFRPVSYAVLSAAQLLVNVSLIILLVVQFKWGIIGVFTATLVSAVLFFAINLLITRQYFSFTFSKKRLVELLRYGIPLIPYGITVYLIQNSARYFLSYFSTLDEVGLYSLGLQLTSILAIFFIGTGLAWGPLIYSTYKEDNIKAVYSKLTNYFIAAALLLVIGLSLFSREILAVFTTPQYYGAYIVVPFLALYFTFFYIGLRMSFGINIAMKTFHFTWISVLTAAINIGLNFLLVPPYGMLGAAIAALACSIVWCVLLVIISQRYYQVDYNLSAFFKILALSVALICAGYFLFSNVNLWNILIKIVLLCIFVACVYIFQLIGKDEFKYLNSQARKVFFREKTTK